MQNDNTAFCRRLCYGISLSLLLLITCGLTAHAGECLTDNDELYVEVAKRYTHSHDESAEESAVSWGLECWRRNKRDDAKLKKLLMSVMTDSRVHPSEVAAAIGDYETVFGRFKTIPKEVTTRQGESRTILIQRLRNAGNSTRSLTRTTAVMSFQPDTDFINGPATLHALPNGTTIATLPDNTRVSRERYEGDWVAVTAGKQKGWVHRSGLMGLMVNTVDRDGTTVLSRAAAMGYLDTVRYLLQQGADVNFADSYGASALHAAAFGALHDLGGDELAILELLCSVKGAVIDQTAKRGSTPLMSAIVTGRAEAVKILLDHGAKRLDVKDMDGETPLLLAVNARNPAILEILLARGRMAMDITDREGNTPLLLAVRNGDTRMATLLLTASGVNINQPDQQGRTPLFHATAQGNLPLMRLLIDQNAAADTITKDGKTLYHAAFTNYPYQPPSLEAIGLLQTIPSVDINRKDPNGRTALSLAIEFKMLPLVRQLLKSRELDVNSASCAGSSCLNRTLADWNDSTSDAMSLLLLERPEINVNARDSSGYTAVHMAWYASGAEAGVEKAKKILARRPNLEALNEHGETPLIHNIVQNKPEMVRLLVAAEGINIDNPGEGSANPLKIAKIRLAAMEMPGQLRSKIDYELRANMAAIVTMLTNAGAHEYLLLGTDAESPEGIPQTLLQNDQTDEAIRIYRSYLIDTTASTLEAVRSGAIDEAIKKQEYILNEIVYEVGDNGVGGGMVRLSAGQRLLARKTFAAIREYYDQFPQKTDNWCATWPDEKKARCTPTMKQLAEIQSGKYDALPDGENANHPPMLPILIFRDYMARNSIAVLKMLRTGKISDAELFMDSVVKRSKPNIMLDKNSPRS